MNVHLSFFVLLATFSTFTFAAIYNEPVADYDTTQPRNEPSFYYTPHSRNEASSEYNAPQSSNELVYYTYTKDDEYRFQIECQQELNATTEDMKVLEVYQQMPKSKTQFCLLGCYYKKIGLLDPENYLNYERAMEDIKVIQVYERILFKKLAYIVKECIQIIQPSIDECIAAQQYFTCILIGTSKLRI